MTAFSKDSVKLANVSTGADDLLTEQTASIEANKVEKTAMSPDVMAVQPRPKLPAFVNPH